MRKIYNVIYIGCGPATIFSVLGYPIKNSLIIEKGKSISNRDPKEVLYGFGGAGAYSDSKLVSNPFVGGDIKNLTNISNEEFNILADNILYYYNHFYDPEDNWNRFSWIKEDNYKISSEKLQLLKSRVSHVGSDKGREIFQNIEDHIQKNICPINFEEEVIGMGRKVEPNLLFKIYTNKGEYETKNVIIGIGKRSNLVTDLIKQFNLKSKPNKIQIGVRVECPNKYFKELINKFYDFKLVMTNKLGHRFRTFCVCGKKAYVTVETSFKEDRSLEFLSANGAAVEGNNGVINFGVMGELDLKWTREEQIKEMQKVNAGTDKLLFQNISDFIYKKETKKLNFKSTVEPYYTRLGNLWDFYPTIICNGLKEFLVELRKVEWFDGHLIAPEIKITNPLIEMSNNFEVHPGLFIIGDASGYTRSIIQAGITGMVVGKYLDEVYNGGVNANNK